MKRVSLGLERRDGQAPTYRGKSFGEGWPAGAWHLPGPINNRKASIVGEVSARRRVVSRKLTVAGDSVGSS